MYRRGGQVEQLPDTKSEGDIAYEVGRAIVAAIPVAGGSLQVVFENVFTAPIERRKAAWLAELVGVIEELQRRVEGLEASTLGQNEAFVTTAMQASQVALRNHQREKLDALRHAVLHSGLPGAPSDDEQAIFVRLIDELTPWHLRILTFLDDPEQWMREHGIANPGWGMGGVSTVLEHCFSELVGQRELYDQMLADLQSAGLAAAGSYLHATMTGQGMLASRTTGIGKRFLSFITSPADI